MAKNTGSGSERALFEAVMSGDVKKAESALSAGADVDCVDKERSVTPLILAVVRNDIAMAGLLLSNKADANKGFRQPVTEEDKEMIRSLRKMREEDPAWKPQGDTVKNEDAILSGKITEIDVSPLSIAKRKRNEAMMTLLRKYGARG